MGSIAWLIGTVAQICIFLLLAQVIASWLVAFNVINTRHPFFRQQRSAVSVPDHRTGALTEYGVSCRPLVVPTSPHWFWRF